MGTQPKALNLTEDPLAPVWLWESACSQAGHAVIGHMVGFTCTGASIGIAPDGGWVGFLEWPPPVSEPPYDAPRYLRRALRRACLVLCAGQAACNVLCGYALNTDDLDLEEGFDAIFDQDYDTSLWLKGQRGNAGIKDMWGFLDRLLRKARSMVSGYRHQVRDFAEALYVRRRLTGEEARELLAKLLPPSW